MNAQELKGLTVAKNVDTRGMACPGPLLEAKRVAAEIAGGGILVVLSSDENTVPDLKRWSAKMEHGYLGEIEENGHWSIYVKMKG